MTRRVARSPSRMSALTTHDYPGSEEGDPATHRQTTDACRGAQTKGLPIPAMAFPVEEQPLNRPAVEIGLHLPRARREVGDPAPWLVGGLVADRAELSRRSVPVLRGWHQSTRKVARRGLSSRPSGYAPVQSAP